MSDAAPPSESSAPARRPVLPRAVWVLGFVSLGMDVSSEMIHALLPALVVVHWGASTVVLGLLEGGAEAIASFLKIVSGTWSDRSGRRKRLAVLGYGLSAVVKPLFALATALPGIAVARAVDRVGKGIRGAPRDAMIADVTAPEIRGAAYGLRQALDTIGALLGPAIAIAWMWREGATIQSVFVLAIVPAWIAVALLVIGVRETSAGPRAGKPAPALRELSRLGPAAWRVVVIAAAVALVRATEAFWVLAAIDRGLDERLSPLGLAVMSACYAAASYPAGRWADRIAHPRMLAIGCAVLVVAHATVAAASGPWITLVGIAIYGLHLALSQGLLSAWMANVAPADARGTAFGMLHFATGVATISSGLLVGFAWDELGATRTFAIGAAASVGVVVLVIALGRRAGRG